MTYLNKDPLLKELQGLESDIRANPKIYGDFEAGLLRGIEGSISFIISGKFDVKEQ